MAAFIILYFQHCASLSSNFCPHFLVSSVAFAAAIARLTGSSTTRAEIFTLFSVLKERLNSAPHLAARSSYKVDIKAGGG